MRVQQPLTESEIRVSVLLLEGLSNKAIAKRLVLSPRTVECHLSRAMAKTGCANRLELALWMLTMSPMPA
ncbi:helix-turn-helix domain-containing protein [Synechococcus sp. MIT S1220]|uniref:helix-turn-helix domain-containing protein n=1 Tax=Synechococcus sp. MIT S1220 TaxID=3082549 RepID=UPI0039B01BB0